MHRRRLALTIGLVIGVFAALLLVIRIVNADLFVPFSQTTLNDFNTGAFDYTGLATVGDPNDPQSGAVSLLPLGVAGEWIAFNPTGLPPLYAQGTVEHDWHIYTIGGNLGGATATNAVYKARIITGTLTGINSLSSFSQTTPLPSDIYPTGLFNHSVAVVGDYVYVIGGQNSNSLVKYSSVIYSQFDPTTGELGPWQTATSLPQPRVSAATVVLSNTIYVLGGQNSSFNPQSTVYYARPETTGMITQWYTASGSLPETLYGNMAATNGTFIYGMGGMQSASNPRPDVFYAAPTSEGDIPITPTGWITGSGWVTTTHLTNSVFRGAGLSVNRILFVTGGELNLGGPLSDKVMASYLENDGSIRFWGVSTGTLNLNPARLWHGAVADPDGFLYVIGGADVSGVSPIQTGIVNIGRTSGEGAMAYAPNGRYTSPPIQLGPIDRILYELSWSSLLPTNQVTLSASYRYRGIADLDWSGWQGPFPSNGGTGVQTTTIPISGTAKFFQYRVDFGNSAGISNSYIVTTPFLLGTVITYIIPAPPDLVKTSLPIDQLADPTRGQVAPGDLISYTIVLTSQSVNALPGAVVTDWLPLGTTFVPNSAYYSATFPVVTNLADGAVGWSFGTFPAGFENVAVLGYAVRVNSNVKLGDLLTNTAIFQSNVNEPIVRLTRHEVDAPISVDKQATSSAPPGSWRTVETGDRITYTVVLSNPNSGALTGAVITDSVPLDTSYVDGSISITPPLSGTADASQLPRLRWDVPVLGAHDMVTAQFSVLVTTTVRDTVIRNVGWAYTDQSSPHASPPVDFTVVAPTPLSKMANPPSGQSALRGSLIVYTLFYTNLNSVSLSNMIISDSLPANTTFDSCLGCAQVGNVLAWTRAVAPFASDSVSFTVKVNSTAPVGDQITNTAKLSSNQQHLPTQSNMTTHTVVAVTIGQISKAASPPGGQSPSQSVPPGALITYTLSYVASASLTGASIVDQVPANTDYVSCSGGPGGCSFNGTNVSWVLGALAPNATGQVRLTVRVNPSTPDGTIIQNQASLACDQGSIVSDPVTHRVLIPYDLQLTKAVNTTATRPGSTFIYTLVYTNQGSFTLNGVVITDTLGSVPQGQWSGPAMPYLTVLDSTPGWQLLQASSSGNIYRYNTGTMLPGGTGMLTMAVHLNNSVPLSLTMVNNQAIVADDGAHGYDANSSNQFADLTTPVQGSDLVISNWQVSPGPYSARKTFYVTATITNRGLDPVSAWDHLLNPNTSNWFVVELYAKPSSFAQSGPPTGPLDHAGGFCDNEQTSGCDSTHQRRSFINPINQPITMPLAPGASIQASFTVSVTNADVYSLYLQVDTGFWDPPDLYFSFGRVLESNELNNIVSLGSISMGRRVYLPIVLRSK